MVVLIVLVQSDLQFPQLTMLCIILAHLPFYNYLQVPFLDCYGYALAFKKFICLMMLVLVNFNKLSRLYYSVYQ